MKKLISFFLIILMTGSILTGCGKATLTDMVDRYEFIAVEDDVILWQVYFKDDYKSSEYDYEDFIDVIKECMSRSGQYSFSNAWVLAFDSDGYTSRFSWNTTENRYIITQTDGTIPNLRTYEWNLTVDQVNDIWDSIGFKTVDDGETSDEIDTEELEKETADISLEDEGVTEDYYWQSLYINPDYDEFNTPASENGLDGTLIYVDGMITDIKYSDDFDFYYLTEEDGNFWVFSMYNDNPISPNIGDEIEVYGEYRGQASNYEDRPYLMAIRYIMDDNMVKMIGHAEDVTDDCYLYPSIEGFPNEYVNDIKESEDNGFYHYTLTLSEWDDLGFDKQCSLAKSWVVYCADLFSASGMTKNDFDITAYDENGSAAFIFDGGDSIEIYSRSM